MCTKGSFVGQQKDPKSWEKVSDAIELKRSEAATTVLPEPVHIGPGETRGFYLHSTAHNEAVAYVSESQNQSWKPADAGEMIKVTPGNYSSSSTPFKDVNTDGARTLAGGLVYSCGSMAFPSTVLQVTEKHLSPLLYLSCDQGDDDLCEALFYKHDQFDAASEQGAQLLQRAFETKLMKFAAGMLEANAGGNATNASVASQLRSACVEGDLERARLFLQHGANANAKENGESILTAACRAGHTRIVDALLANHVDVTARHDSGFNPGDTVEVHQLSDEFTQAFKKTLGKFDKHDGAACGKEGVVEAAMQQQSNWVVDVYMKDGSSKTNNEVRSTNTVEKAVASYYGLFWDVQATSDFPIHVTGIIAGSIKSGDCVGTLYMCTKGPCAGNESDPSAWAKVSENVSLKNKKTSTTKLSSRITIEPGSSLGFFLHSSAHSDAVAYSKNPEHKGWTEASGIAIVDGNYSESSTAFREVSNGPRQLVGGVLFQTGVARFPSTVLSVTKPHPSPLMHVVCQNNANDAVAKRVVDADKDSIVRQGAAAQLFKEACRHGLSQTASSLLVGSGMNLDASFEDNGGRTPLTLACEQGDLSLAKLLLAHGANPDAVDDNGDTPLYLACKGGNSDLGDLLIGNRATPSFSHSSGINPGDVVNIKQDSDEFKQAFRDVFGECTDDDVSACVVACPLRNVVARHAVCHSPRSRSFVRVCACSETVHLRSTWFVHRPSIATTPDKLSRSLGKTWGGTSALL